MQSRRKHRPSARQPSSAPPAAEGVCQAQIALATGERQVTVLRARGVADSRVLIAKAEAEAVKVVALSLQVRGPSWAHSARRCASLPAVWAQGYGVNPTHYLVSLRYLDTFVALAARAAERTIYFPFEVRMRACVCASVRVRGLRHGGRTTGGCGGGAGWQAGGRGGALAVACCWVMYNQFLLRCQHQRWCILYIGLPALAALPSPLVARVGNGQLHALAQ